VNAPTCCPICVDAWVLTKLGRPTDDILDFVAMDTAGLGARLRRHGNRELAATIEPGNPGVYAQDALGGAV
jgi:hypothetical protein